MSATDSFCSRIPYSLPDNPHVAIMQLADYLGIPRPTIPGDERTLLKSMCGTILYRHLPQRERKEAMTLIQTQDARTASYLRDIALQSTFITPSWHPPTMTTEELSRSIAFHDELQRYMGFYGLNPGALGTAVYAWKLIRDSASSPNLLKFLASLSIFMAGELSNAELNELRQELDQRKEFANENSAH